MSFGQQFQNLAIKRKRLADDEDDHEDSKLVGQTVIHLDSEDDDGDLDDSDDSDDDEGEGDEETGTGVCEYYESAESYPNCVAYDKDFEPVAKALTDIPKAAIAIIDRSGSTSTRVQGCRSNAEELIKVPPPKREKACLLGNTGAGKSSLLNALLGLPGLAKAMAGGQSCTYVGTEYRSPFHGQAKKFAAKVEYFDIDAIRVLLQRLLVDYNRWMFEQADDWSEDEIQEYKRSYITAFTTFKSLFCDEEEFGSPRAAEEFLQEAYNGNADALEKMVGYCEALLDEKEADEFDHLEYLDADSQQELLDQLSPLVSSNSQFEEPTLWPLVKKVTMGIEGPRILKYMTLLDLPGLDDTNQVRVDASYDMMRSCDWIWVVTKIDRAITDTTVDSLLIKYGKSFKMAIVCTGIDANLEDDLAAHLQSEGQSIGDHDELFDREKQLRKLTRSLTKKIETRRAKLEGRNIVKNNKKRRLLTDKQREKLKSQVSALEAELNGVEQELPVVAQERFELLVDARNHNTMVRLQGEKTDHLKPGRQLQVFCVSNVHYMALKGARVISGPRLNAEMTGIPAMRTFVLELAAPGLVQAVDDFVSYRFTVFMQGLAMWAKSFSVEGSAELLAGIEAPRAKISNLLQKFLHNMEKVAEEKVIKVVDDSRLKQLGTASKFLEKKKGWHWGTARAFIRRNGDHRTSVQPKQCWNEQFLEGLIEVVNEEWALLEHYREEVEKGLRSELVGLVHGVRDMVKSHPAHMILPMDRVTKIFEAHHEGVMQACSEQKDELDHELRNIYIDLTQHRNTGYFTQAMGKVYEKCQEDGGAGVKVRTFNSFENHLNLPGVYSPFAIVGQKFSKAVSKDVKEKNKSLFQKIDRVFRDLYTQFDDIVDQKMDDKEEEAVRKRFRVYLPGAERNFEAIKDDFAQLKGRYEEALVLRE